MDEKYFIGLDIGTDSVGWAVTDDNYKLKKFRNNLMWGVNLFDEASQSAERRYFRTARRRGDRKKQRLELLKEFFGEDILKTDSHFFHRLKESGLLPEDAENRKKSIFFDDPNYTDKEYYKQYPTIHHLICSLMNDRSPHDVRLVYLACAYILGHRGHFLFEVDKDNISQINDFSEIYSNFYDSISDIVDTVPFDSDSDPVADILRSGRSITKKEEQFFGLFFGGKRPKKDEYEIRIDLMIKMISGGSVKLSELFRKEEYKELEKNTVSVSSADFSDTLEILYGQIEETEFRLIENIKAMYDWSLLVDILGNHSMISEAKVDIYEQHKSDLVKLKRICKKYLTVADYKAIFKDICDKPNYASYVYNASADSRPDKYKKCKDQGEFCKYIQGYISGIKPNVSDKDDLDELLQKCNDKTLCPKQVTTDNRVIPYQLYYVELKKILENAKEYLPFLNEKDQYGTVADKILSIMEFRIPYYVGPLVSSNRSNNAWMIRKADGKIYPWNFNEIVDHEKTENEFIRRMTCKCTYLAGEDVLPKHSLLYSKFNVLNEINNICVEGVMISVDLKQRIYNELFMQKKKVTKKAIEDFLINTGNMTKGQKISGIDDNVKSSLKPYFDFKTMLTVGKLTENDVEAIIERITVTTDTMRLKKWLKSNYNTLSDDDIKYISRLGYKDYGRLSRKFFEEIYAIDADTGEVISDKNIITMLWETNENLMKLLGLKYGYINGVNHFNKVYYEIPENCKTIDERMKEMYIPTSVRRSITRTVDIVKELKGILNKDPDKIFIEMPRGTGDTPKGSRTVSRRDRITDWLKAAGEDDDGRLEGELARTDDGQLRSDKYFLYFMQLGKCMYTGKDIPFDEIADNHRWNIDHIWPQAKTKDDSIDNKVLVNTKVNGAKGDNYPISSEIRNKMNGFWAMLRAKELISEKKYQRLNRNTPFTEEELSGFIARQLVETRQSTKAVAELLKEICPDSDIVYVKAGLVSEFRQEFDMLKCREINDLHHAKDAYLNIVVGNVYDVMFTKNPLKFVRSNTLYTMNLFKSDSEGEPKGMLTKKIQRNGLIAWDPDSSFDIVRKMMGKNSIRYVRYCYRRKHGQNGGFFDQNPLRKGKGMVPLKKNLSIEKYGGYDNATISFFSIVQCSGIGCILIAVELIIADKYVSDLDYAKEYVANKLSNALNKKVDKDMVSFPLNNRIIKINTVFDIDGYRVNIVAKTNSSIKYTSAESLILPPVQEKYYKRISSFLEKSERGKKYLVPSDIITNDDNIALYECLMQKCNTVPFVKMYSDIGKLFIEKEAEFKRLDLLDQLFVLSEMVRLLKTGRKTSVDLLLIGGKKNMGVKALNMNLYKINNIESISIIDQSPTGLFEKRSVNLLDL